MFRIRAMGLEPVRAYLGLGANIGDRRKNLETALDLLSEKLQIVRVSSLYDTAPVGEIDQPRFLNMVCEVYTILTPAELLELAKSIEMKLGRKRSRRNAPRTIDIDILFYGDRIIETPEVVIPHPRLTKRAFVLVPMAEIAPGFVHPVNGKTIEELMRVVGGKEGVIKVEEKDVSDIHRARF